nr:helix-hairpin-helix domain-containing protein [Prauserella rugosa]
MGQARKSALIKHFGSVKKLKQASVDDIAQVPGFGKRTAEAVYTALAGGNGNKQGESQR